MTNFLLLIFKSVAYGLALALLYLLLAPSGQLQLAHLLQPAESEPAAISYARAVRAAAPAVVNVYAAKDRDSGPLVEAIAADIAAHRPRMPQHGALDTVYFGGGTPTSLAIATAPARGTAIVFHGNAGHAGQRDHLAAALAGTPGRPPDSADAEQPLQDMVEAIRQGRLDAFIPFDRRGTAVALG